MNKDELVQEIGTMLVQDPGISRWSWQHLAIVVQFRGSSSQVNGFAYLDTGDAQITSPKNFEVPKKFKALREAMREPGKEPWQACLVRIDRATGRVSVDFEYDHPEKWLISPATLKKMAETLRPN
jgi:hypothetical protein